MSVTQKAKKKNPLVRMENNLLLHVDLFLLHDFFLFLNNTDNDLPLPLEISKDFPENSPKNVMNYYISFPISFLEIFSVT